MTVYKVGPKPRYHSDISPQELRSHSIQGAYDDFERLRWAEELEIKISTGTWKPAEDFDLAEMRFPLPGKPERDM